MLASKVRAAFVAKESYHVAAHRIESSQSAYSSSSATVSSPKAAHIAVFFRSQPETDKHHLRCTGERQRGGLQ